jgi:polysaccharide pyruvyl transferase WcaK-like protein
VRDASSSELLTQLKIEHYYGSDLAWSLASIVKSRKPRAESTKVIVSLRQTKEPLEKIVNALKDLLLDCDAEPVFLIMQSNDELFTRQVMEELQVSAEITNASDYEPQALIKLLQESFSIMISMRLHALILAHIAGLELRAIVCDPKLDELLLQIKGYDLVELSERAEKCCIGVN